MIVIKSCRSVQFLECLAMTGLECDDDEDDNDDDNNKLFLLSSEQFLNLKMQHFCNKTPHLKKYPFLSHTYACLRQAESHLR